MTAGTRGTPLHGKPIAAFVLVAWLVAGQGAGCALNPFRTAQNQDSSTGELALTDKNKPKIPPPPNDVAKQINELMERGARYELAGQQASARSTYEQVLQLHSGHAPANHRLGIVADKEGRYSDAERHYRAALAVTPNDPDLLSDLGYSYLLQGNTEQSVSVLQTALMNDPQHRRALTNLGHAEERNGRIEAALYAFRAAGNDAEAKALMARIPTENLFTDEQSSAMLQQAAATANMTGGVPPNPFAAGSQYGAQTPGIAAADNVSAAKIPLGNSPPGNASLANAAAANAVPAGVAPGEMFQTASGNNGSRTLTQGSLRYQREMSPQELKDYFEEIDRRGLPTNGQSIQADYSPTNSSGMRMAGQQPGSTTPQQYAQQEIDQQPQFGQQQITQQQRQDMPGGAPQPWQYYAQASSNAGSVAANSSPSTGPVITAAAPRIEPARMARHDGGDQQSPSTTYDANVQTASAAFETNVDETASSRRNAATVEHAYEAPLNNRQSTRTNAGPAVSNANQSGRFARNAESATAHHSQSAATESTRQDAASSQPATAAAAARLGMNAGSGLPTLDLPLAVDPPAATTAMSTMANRPIDVSGGYPVQQAGGRGTPNPSFDRTAAATPTTSAAISPVLHAQEQAMREQMQQYPQSGNSPSSNGMNPASGQTSWMNPADPMEAARGQRGRAQQPADWPYKLENTSIPAPVVPSAQGRVYGATGSQMAPERRWSDDRDVSGAQQNRQNAPNAPGAGYPGNFNNGTMRQPDGSQSRGDSMSNGDPTGIGNVPPNTTSFTPIPATTGIKKLITAPKSWNVFKRNN